MKGLRTFIGNTNDYNGEAYQRMVDTLSSYGRHKVDTAKREQFKKQRILAYYLLESQNPGARYSWEESAESVGNGDGNGDKNFTEPCRYGDLFYSISHSGRLVAVALSDLTVGIDIEEPSRITTEQVRRLGKSHFFTTNERERLPSASVEEFLLVWTFKEAMTKLLRKPLTQTLGEIDYYKAAEGLVDREGVFAWQDRSIEMRQWTGEDAVGTVVAERLY